MAGIYIHVPFCKKKCLYCDFYSIEISDKQNIYVSLIEKELTLRKGFIAEECIETIYFGGGTPSLLPPDCIDKIIKTITSIFSVSIKAEITLEANPDDISLELLAGYKKAGINRLSIGIQSFIDKELSLLGRRHDASSAVESIYTAKKAGFDNLSVDLIYGLPNSTIESWEYNLKKAFSLDINHLSCYHLTFEEGTPISRMLEKNVINEVDEDLSVLQFNALRKIAKEHDFIHYEVSNLAKKGVFSQHNTSYWRRIPYLGVGPAAHSFNCKERQWNPKSFNEWQAGVDNESPAIQGEILDKKTMFNEILLTHLRTIWGVDLVTLRKDFGEEMVNQLLNNCKEHIERKSIVYKDNTLVIPPDCFFLSDGIIADLIIVD